MVRLPIDINTQQLLSGTAAKDFAKQSVKIAHDVAESAPDWYQPVLDFFSRLIESFSTAFPNFAEDLSVFFSQLIEKLSVFFQALWTWFSGPQFRKLFTIWLSVFAVVYTFMCFLGFGRSRVRRRTIGTGWQSYVYDENTAREDYFTFLMSDRMWERAPSVAYLTASSIAGFVTMTCFFSG